MIRRRKVIPVDPDLLGFTQDIQQDNRALFAIVCLEDGLQPLQGAVHNGDGLAGFEQGFFGSDQLGVRVCQLEQGVNERLGNRGRQAAEADKLGDAAGGADRGDVVLAEVKADEKIAREQGFDRVLPLEAIAAGLFDFG